MAKNIEATVRGDVLTLKIDLSKKGTKNARGTANVLAINEGTWETLADMLGLEDEQAEKKGLDGLAAKVIITKKADKKPAPKKTPARKSKAEDSDDVDDDDDDAVEYEAGQAVWYTDDEDDRVKAVVKRVKRDGTVILEDEDGDKLAEVEEDEVSDQLEPRRTRSTNKKTAKKGGKGMKRRGGDDD